MCAVTHSLYSTSTTEAAMLFDAFAAAKSKELARPKSIPQ